MSPLTRLINYLLLGEAPPFDWIVEHAPDGTLEALWEEERDPDKLVTIGEIADPEATIAALAAIIAPLRRLMTVPAETMERIFVDVLERRRYELDKQLVAEYRSFVRHAFATTTEKNAVRAAVRFVDRSDDLAGAARDAVEALRSEPVHAGNTRTDHAKYVADQIRALVPCPDLGRLLAQTGASV